MYWAGGLLGMSHEANIQEYRESLPPNLLKQLEAAEERFLTVDGQILEMLEKSEHGDAMPADELAAKREARRQESKGGGHARHA
jgi:UDP-N-acetyl-D-mannosaminuronate dehydrogenase